MSKTVTPPADLFNEVEKIESVSTYDLSEVTATADDSAPHFVEPEEKEEKPAKKERKPRTVKQREQAPPTLPPFGAENTHVLDEQEQEQESASNLMPDGVVTLASVMPAETLMIVIDKALSVIFPLAINAIAGTRLKPADFKLSADEKKTMKPAVERAAATIKLNFNNPWLVLGITTVAVYGAKAAAHINFDDADAEDLGAPRRETRGRKRKEGGRDYAAEYAKRKERENAWANNDNRRNEPR